MYLLDARRGDACLQVERFTKSRGVTRDWVGVPRRFKPQGAEKEREHAEAEQQSLCWELSLVLGITLSQAAKQLQQQR